MKTTLLTIHIKHFTLHTPHSTLCSIFPYEAWLTYWRTAGSTKCDVSHWTATLTHVRLPDLLITTPRLTKPQRQLWNQTWFFFSLSSPKNVLILTQESSQQFIWVHFSVLKYLYKGILPCCKTERSILHVKKSTSIHFYKLETLYNSLGQ